MNGNGRSLPWLVLAVLLISLCALIVLLSSSHRAAESYKILAENAVSSAPVEPEKPAEPPVTVDWAALKAENADVAAWLYCEGTPINYPVVQAYDNSSYLKRGFDGRDSEAGTLFFDSRNDVALPDDNLIIYGHQMYDDSMLGLLPEWAEYEYYEEHPVMYLLTPARSYRVELFSCRLIEAKDWLFSTSFFDPGDYQIYLDRAVAQSYWQCDTPASADSPTLTLVTCSYYPYAKNPRLLLHGRMIPIE